MILLNFFKQCGSYRQLNRITKVWTSIGICSWTSSNLEMIRRETIFYSRAEPTKSTENRMALPEKQENYVRLSLLLTGISPRAVRCIFDKEFPPLGLRVSLSNATNKLTELKKRRVITPAQWNKLFPTFPDQPKSTSFDVTLMIALLRNLTSLISPKAGYECIPHSTEISTAADLARIKCYRNHLAHLENDEIESKFFKTAWEDVSSAVLRLGGYEMKVQCDVLEHKFLDHSNIQIMNEIHNSNAEILNLKLEMGIVQEQILDLQDNQKNWHFRMPRYVRTQFASATSVKVEWEPPEQTNMDFQGYKIFWKQTGDDASENVKEVTKEENVTIVDGLMEMTDYWLCISAYCAGGETLPHTQQIRFKTQKGVPTRPPQNVICMPYQNGTSIEVNWEPPPEDQIENISGYNVYVQKYSDTIEERVETKRSTINKAIITDLLKSTKYRIWISALSNNGYGPASEPVIICTEASSSYAIFNKVEGGVHFGTNNTLHFNMPGAISHNMAHTQANMINMKRELKKDDDLQLNKPNEHLPIEPPREKRHRKCKKVKK